MTNTVSLTDIRAAADRKYGSYFIQGAYRTYELRPMLRLPENVREDVSEWLTAIDEAPTFATIGGRVQDIVRFVTVNGGDELVGEIGDDLAVLSEVLHGWMAVGQPGEASSSPDSSPSTASTFTSTSDSISV